jgi:hypothetical protein
MPICEAKRVEVFIGNMDRFIYGFMQTGHNYESTWLKIAAVHNFYGNSSVLNFNNFCERVYEPESRVHLWLYVNQALLRIGMVGRRNFSITFS